ncbi:hypothetical protein [Propionivibrio sp.]|uniref:hypothetical protein n=1 Tax=Propionivibrio sp. TaxID=2212460 RepID=UPI003BF0F092
MAELDSHPSACPSRRREGSESPSVVRLAGRKYSTSKPSVSVGGCDRLVKAKPFGRPSAGLDKPPATAGINHRACTDQGAMNSGQWMT